MEVKEYTVVKALTLKKLIEQVNQMIQQGWQPKGGIQTHVLLGSFGSPAYWQAMIR